MVLTLKKGKKKVILQGQNNSNPNRVIIEVKDFIHAKILKNYFRILEKDKICNCFIMDFDEENSYIADILAIVPIKIQVKRKNSKDLEITYFFKYTEIYYIMYFNDSKNCFELHNQNTTKRNDSFVKDLDMKILNIKCGDFPYLEILSKNCFLSLEREWKKQDVVLNGIEVKCGINYNDIVMISDCDSCLSITDPKIILEKTNNFFKK